MFLLAFKKLFWGCSKGVYSKLPFVIWCLSLVLCLDPLVFFVSISIVDVWLSWVFCYSCLYTHHIHVYIHTYIHTYIHIYIYIYLYVYLPRWFSAKESPCKCRRCRRFWFDSWVGKIPWRRKWKPLQYSCLEKFHGQRSLESYSPWSCKLSDMPEWNSIYTHVYILV